MTTQEALYKYEDVLSEEEKTKLLNMETKEYKAPELKPEDDLGLIFYRDENGKMVYTKAHPAMRQQYTYADIVNAFKAGEDLVVYDWDQAEGRSYIPVEHPGYTNFEEWFNNYKFEMLDGK